MAIVEKSVLVNYSAQQMFYLVRAVNQYPEFLPWCANARAEPLEDNIERATIEMAFKGFKQSFTTLNRAVLDKEIHMTLVEGPFSHLAGTWHFTALTANACKVHFRLEYEFSSRLLEQLLGPVFNGVANSLVDSFITRAELQYSAGAGS